MLLSLQIHGEREVYRKSGADDHQTKSQNDSNWAAFRREVIHNFKRRAHKVSEIYDAVWWTTFSDDVFCFSTSRCVCTLALVLYKLKLRHNKPNQQNEYFYAIIPSPALTLLIFDLAPETVPNTNKSWCFLSSLAI